MDPDPPKITVSGSVLLLKDINIRQLFICFLHYKNRKQYIIIFREKTNFLKNGCVCEDDRHAATQSVAGGEGQHSQLSGPDTQT